MRSVRLRELLAAETWVTELNAEDINVSDNRGSGSGTRRALASVE
jgi:hypothetical protein